MAARPNCRKLFEHRGPLNRALASILAFLKAGKSTVAVIPGTQRKSGTQTKATVKIRCLADGAPGDRGAGLLPEGVWVCLDLDAKVTILR